MVLKNYKNLLIDVKMYLNRDDEDTLSRIPMWIDSAHDVLDRMVRHPAGETNAMFTMKAGTDIIPIPTNLLELKHLRIPETGTVMYRRTLENLYDDVGRSELPTGYSRKVNWYILNKKVERDVVFEVIYYTAPTKLKEPGDINLYTVQCYDILLYYTLAEAFAYLLNSEESNLYGQKASQAFEMLKSALDREEHSGSTLVYLGDLQAASMYF